MEFNPDTSSFPCFNNSNASGLGSHQQSSGRSSGASDETDGAVGGFDLMTWYPKHQSCQHYFVEVAQRSYPCQALAGFINIKLPFQRVAGSSDPPTGSTAVRSPPPLRLLGGSRLTSPLARAQLHRPTMHSYGWVSLYPYIRRLVAMGFDALAILHGWLEMTGCMALGHSMSKRGGIFSLWQRVGGGRRLSGTMIWSQTSASHICSRRGRFLRGNLKEQRIYGLSGSQWRTRSWERENPRLGAPRNLSRIDGARLGSWYSVNDAPAGVFMGREAT